MPAELTATGEMVLGESQDMNQALTPGRAALLAFLNNFKDSTLHTYKRFLGMIVELCDTGKKNSKANSKAQATSEELKTRLLSFDWTRVDLHFVRRIHRLAQNEKYSQSTRNSLLVVCRGIAKERMILKQITSEEYWYICEVGKRTRERGKREKKSKVISFEDLIKMLHGCLADEKCKLGMRDFALISLLYGTGLRGQEAVNLRLDQVDFENETVTIIGKGDDERRVWAVKGVIPALRRWLEYHTPVDGVMFPAFAPMTDEPIRDRVNIPMSYKALYDMVRARALAVGAPVPSPHSFRHSFATLTYQHTEDIFAVQLQLGHKDRKTTEGYIAHIQGEKAKQKAAASWSLPS
jgi:integrase